MYLTHLRIENMKRVEHLELDFTNAGGNPRMWTVLIGENGTAKTTILHAIAMAAAGHTWINDVARPIIPSLIPTERGKALEVEVQFAFTDHGRRYGDHLGLKGLPAKLALRSRVNLDEDYSTLLGHDNYVLPVSNARAKEPASLSPLDRARARGSAHWFVAAYGVSRALPSAGETPELSRPGVDRLRQFFQPRVGLTSIDFIDVFGPKSPKGKRFVASLRKILIGTGILPDDIVDIQLGGRSGARSPSKQPFRNHFIQRSGMRTRPVPMDGIAHGMKSTMAWIADLVGHIIFESDADLTSSNMEGVVLLDEIDIFLSPAWQARLVPALRKTFPRLQFIVTAHNPGILSSFESTEVVHLKIDPNDGSVKRFAPDELTGVVEPVNSPGDVASQPDPRELSGSELYESYFGMAPGPLNPSGAMRRELAALKTVPWRTPTQEARLAQLKAELEPASAEGTTPNDTNRVEGE